MTVEYHRLNDTIIHGIAAVHVLVSTGEALLLLLSFQVGQIKFMTHK